MASLKFMTKSERSKYISLVLGRCLTAVFDFVGVLAIGYLATSIALFVAKGSNPNRTFRILGVVFPAANIHLLPYTVGVILSVFVIKALLATYLTRKTANLLALVESRASRRVVETVLGAGLEKSRSISKEELTFVTNSSTSSAFSGILTNTATLTAEGFMFAGLLVTFFLVDPMSTILVLGYLALLAWAMQLFIGKRLSRTATVIVKNAIATGTAINDLSGAFRELAVAGKRESFLDSIESSRLALASATGRQLYLASMPRYIVETGVLVGVFAFGAVKLLSGDITSSMTTIGIFFTGSMRIMAAMLPWQAALVEMRRNAPQALISQKYLLETPVGGVPKKSSARRTQLAPVSIRMRDVTYKYPEAGTPAVHNVSLEVPAGYQVALIGASGSGKSTIADLMMGLLEPQAGSILVDGEPPSDLISATPGILSYVPQKPGGLEGTLATNIAIGEDPTVIDRTRIANALKLAHLTDLVESLPHGLESDLGKYRDSLSGGQLQRVGLARALYSMPSLLVMDEATSALDAESENEITQAIAGLRGKVTVVMIAHRLNTVQHADIVFLVDEGRIADQGTFSEIVERNESIARAVDLMSFSDRN